MFDEKCTVTCIKITQELIVVDAASSSFQIAFFNKNQMISTTASSSAVHRL
jgi:hypothetical protein